MENHKDKQTAKLKNIFYGASLAVVLLIYYLLYFNRCLPLNEGWAMAYSKLMSEGKMPYRDFYYYLPPFDLFEGFIFWKLSSGHFLVFRALRMAERIFSFEILFFELKKYTTSFGAWVGCIIGGVFMSATNHDLLGDYTYSSATLCILAACSMNRFISAGSELKKNIWMIVSGALLGIMMNLRQPLMAAACMALFLYLIFYCIKKREPFLKRAVQAIFGLLIPSGIICVYLISNNAFAAMLDQVFLDTTSKGGSPLNIIFAPFALLTRQYEMLLISAALIFLFYNDKYNILKVFKKGSAAIQRTFLIVIFAAFIVFSGFYIHPDYILFHIIYAVFICGLFAVLFFTERRFGNVGEESIKSIIPATVVIAAFIVLEALMIIVGGFSAEMYEERLFYKGTRNFSYIIFVLSIFFMGYLGLHKKAEINWGLLSLLVCSFIYEYNCLMSSREYITPYSVCIALPVFVALLLDHKVKYNNLKRACIIAGGFVICMFCMSQKIANAFSWWGTDEKTLNEETYSVDVTGLEGFRTSKEQSNMFEQVYKSVEYNTDENSTVLGYPFITMFNVLNDRDFAGFVPVHFYDVCSDKYAIRDAELFKEDPPDLVIYADIPGCLQKHEEVFRNDERAGQREIMEWLAASEQYTLVCRVSNVFVYKLNGNGVDIGYTYFETDDYDNISLDEIREDLIESSKSPQ